MNERIKQLAEQADITLSERDGWWVAYDEDLERFAELVRQDEREQEPVAWVDKVWVERLDISKQLRMELLFSRCQLNNNQIPLYTAPPKPEQEPVAYKYTDKTNPLVFYFTTHKDSLPNPDVIETALYTAPPKREWVGLTDKELEEIQYARDTEVEYVTYDEGEDRFEIDIFPENFARAIEAKLKEKNYG
jgi:hypothetical protein